MGNKKVNLLEENMGKCFLNIENNRQRLLRQDMSND